MDAMHQNALLSLATAIAAEILEIDPSEVQCEVTEDGEGFEVHLPEVTDAAA